MEGLHSQPQHNGCDGVILQYVEKTGRCKVKLLSCGRVLAVRPANLRLRAVNPDRTPASEPASESAGAVLTQLLAKTVFIAGLPDEHSMRVFCGQFGAVLGVTIFQKSAKFKSWAFVTFGTLDDANKAIRMGLINAGIRGTKTVKLQSGAETWEAAVQIRGSVDVGAKKARELAAHAARVSVLASDATASSEEEEEDPAGEAQAEAEAEAEGGNRQRGAARSNARRGHCGRRGPVDHRCRCQWRWLWRDGKDVWHRPFPDSHRRAWQRSWQHVRPMAD
eukprot:SAG22_NODE_4106_length_1384_cov_1.414786_2_plen_278_part_00